MRVLHLASFNRWTGATAPAFAEVEALREAGIDARFAYVGGYKLERKIGEQPFVYPVIRKVQNPWTFVQSVRAIRDLVERERIDLVHSHLTYDHWLARIATSRKRVKTVRTFHALRPLRRDPISRRLIASTDGIAVVNREFVDHDPIRHRAPLFTPPPVNHATFHRVGPDARSIYGIGSAEPLVGLIGKITPDRGFDEAFDVFARIRRLRPESRLLVVGRGFHRPHLESLSRELGFEAAVIWAGYHEEDLPEHYRAMDVMLFTVTGSDEGHRAVSEAMACGVPVACYPMPGIEAVVGELTPQLVASRRDPDLLASMANEILDQRGTSDLRSACAASTERFSYRETARRLIGLYESILNGGGTGGNS